MGVGVLVDFMLEATFGIAFDTLSQGFVGYRDFAAVKSMNPVEQEAFLQAILLVMLADGELSEQEHGVLQAKMERLENREEVWALAERVQARAVEALHEGRVPALLDEVVGVLTQKNHQRALVNIAWEVHRIDEHRVGDKMDVLRHFCDATGIFPTALEA